MFCHKCGHQNPAQANFCSSCGAALVTSVGDDATITFNVADLGITGQSEEEVTEALNELTSKDAMLFVKRGSNTGATYLLDTDLVRVGRHPDNEIFLDDITVSRRHAEFVRQGDHFLLSDVGSLNGTYVNGKSVDSTQLKPGDEVQIGKFKLVFLTGSHDH